jgi:hypothetical protein
LFLALASSPLFWLLALLAGLTGLIALLGPASPNAVMTQYRIW